MLKRLAKTPKKAQLRLLIVVPFVVQIFIAVGLTSYLSIRNGQQAINDVASELRSEISDRIQLRLQTYLEVPQQVNQFNAEAIEMGLVDLAQFSTLDRYLWKQIHQFNTLTSINLTSENEGYIGIIRREDNSITIGITDKTTGRHQSWATDNQGNRTKILRINPNNAFRQQARYQEALKAGKPTWTKIDLTANPAYLRVWATQPIYNAQGQLLAVTSSSLSLSQISNFLRGLKIGHTGQTFIMERNGFLVATSALEKPFRINYKTGKPERLKATDSNNALTRATANHLVAVFGDLNKIDQSQPLEFRLNGKRQFVQVMPFRDEYGLNWLVVVVVPEADFMAQINANTRTTLLVCLLALMLAILVGMITSRWITEPIIRLSEASMAIASGKLDQNVEVEGVRELRVLATSFNKMVAQLRESFKALKQSNEELETRVEQRTAALRLSEEKFSSAFRASPLPIAITTLTDGCYVEVNDSFLCLLGYELPEVIGYTNAQLQIWVNPNEQANITQIVLTTGAVRNQEVDFCTKTGEVRTVLLSAETINLGGETCLLALCNDITERKQIEQALQEQKEYLHLILDNIPQEVFWKDANLVFLGCNQNWAKSAGLESSEAVVGKTDYDLVLNREMADFFRAEDRRIMESGQPELHIVASKQKPSADGQTIWLDISKIPIHDTDGKVIGIVGVVEDITARKLSEEALRVEQEKSEQLLLNILPQVIADKLKQNLRSFSEDAFVRHSSAALIAEQFDEVTILFADIVGFTPLSARISPQELVNLLNDIFSNFDQLVEKHGLEKIKTIGDAYMVAGGLPMPRNDHAEVIAQMALDMQQAITQFQIGKGEAFQIRIGIHTGPVIAGVIGIKKFIYDLWGDTVNVASRMESQGEPGRIQVTSVTYERLRHQYLFEERGTIPVKGKGEMTTYWLMSSR